MNALAGLGHGARILLAFLLFLVISGQAVYRTLYPNTPIDPQQYADITQHPYASSLGAAFPGLVAGLIAYAVLTWLARKRTKDISN
jgi:L-lactate permease